MCNERKRRRKKEQRRDKKINENEKRKKIGTRRIEASGRASERARDGKHGVAWRSR